MGTGDKLTELVGNQPLLRVQAWRALKASRDVTVLIRPGNHAARRALAGLTARIFQPTEAFEGMGGSMRAGTRTMLRNRGFIMLLADLVDINSTDIREIMAHRVVNPSAKIVRGATSDGKPGHPIFFDRSVYGDLLNLRGDDGGRGVAEKYSDQTHLVELPGNSARLDLDTPEDWAAWRHANPDL